MMTYIWGIMIISSIVFSFFTNNLDNITNAIFSSTEQTVKLTLTMFGLIPLSTGIMNILTKTSIKDSLKKIVAPFIAKIFKTVNIKSKAFDLICLNFTANLLGLGNAATPLGLKAVQEMEKNKDNSVNILKLILINTAALQLIPSTVIGLRSLLGSTSPNSIIPYIWVCSLISLITALIFFDYLYRKDTNK